MCFSAKASFATAGILSTIGVLSIRKAKGSKLVLLAASPLFFAAQQACEGIVWITFNKQDTTSLIHIMAAQGFIFFAGVFWPLWMPSIFYVIESNRKRKKLLLFLSFIGTLTALLYFIAWSLQLPSAYVINHHIDYPVPNYPFDIINKIYAKIIESILSLLYCTVVLLPFFISSIRYLWIVGIAVTIGFFVAAIAYYMAFSSVWCFFAAISSALLYFVVSTNRVHSNS